ncbi:MAG: hypothetical protein RL407_446 [Bacteroidota bacterium]|jgi:hypothetical protein
MQKAVFSEQLSNKYAHLKAKKKLPKRRKIMFLNLIQK